MDVPFVQYFLRQVAFPYRSETVWVIRATNFFDQIIQLLPVPHIRVRSLQLYSACLVIVAVRHSMNHYHESCILQLWEVTCGLFAHVLCQIRRRSLVASPSFLARPPNFARTLLQQYLNPLSLNPFCSIQIFQRRPGLKSLEKICNHRLPVQGYISQLFVTVLSLEYRLILLLAEPSHPYFLPLVEGTKVRLPHPFGKFL